MKKTQSTRQTRRSETELLASKQLAAVRGSAFSRPTLRDREDDDDVGREKLYSLPII